MRKTLIFLMLSIFMFTNVSCAANDTSSQLPAPSSKLVYLKVTNAVASSFDETPDWAPKPNPMAPVDGNMETRWSSGYRDNEWIYFDFGKPKTMSKLIIKWEQAYAPSYEILTSLDAKEWKRLVLRENQTGGSNEIDFPPVTCRYVKLAGLSRVNAEWGISVWEFEPYGPKEANPGELPMEEVFKEKTERADMEKALTGIKLVPGQIVKSPGPITKAEFQRGINYTSWDEDELGMDASDLSLLYLSRLGVGHISLMTVYYQENAESKMIYADEVKTVSDESAAHAINMIHSLGMKVMLKPHVDLADDEARTNIIPSDEWFGSYKKFILHYAELAAKYNVELFCIGTELSNTTTSRWKDKWLDIIKEVKRVYKGPLVYAANWDEYETVSFWNEVDYIGMDAYFSLTKKDNPPKEELINAWNGHADTIEGWLKANNLKQPVIFTEIGYDTVVGSNRQPWRVLPTLSTQVESQEEQANCLESLFISLSKRSWFKGFYWWNYFPRSDIGALGYTLRGKRGEKILTEWFNKLK